MSIRPVFDAEASSTGGVSAHLEDAPELDAKGATEGGQKGAVNQALTRWIGAIRKVRKSLGV